MMTSPVFLITHSCNLDCAHCYDRPNRVLADGDVFDGRFRACLDQLDCLAPSAAIISGGEPMMSPHIDRVVSMVRSASLAVEVFTNGFCSERLLDMRIDAVHTSLDGPPALHNAVRRSLHAFRNFESLVTGAHDRGLPCAVQITVTSSNVDHMEDTLHCLAGYPGVSSVTIEPVVMHRHVNPELALDSSVLDFSRWSPMIAAFLAQREFRAEVRWNCRSGADLRSLDPAQAVASLPVLFDIPGDRWGILGLPETRHAGFESFGARALSRDRDFLSDVLAQQQLNIEATHTYSLEQLLVDALAQSTAAPGLATPGVLPSTRR